MQTSLVYIGWSTKPVSFFCSKWKPKGEAMKSIYIFLLALIVGMTLACSSPQDRAYQAQEKVHKERLKLVEKYQKCMKEAGEDQQKKEACDQYLKASEALK
ncbi:MAG: hypothetical protein AMK69_11190 [Nitrospira bacterium SG8_3]|nr:MAG: hypothetical protein AMK69_11190 [Nitrospira bacterium SG8_3]